MPGRAEGGASQHNQSFGKKTGKNSPYFIPALRTHAYNPPASVAGVFRETFAGRRRPALSSEP
jgi:hypothetical protein